MRVVAATLLAAGLHVPSAAAMVLTSQDLTPNGAVSRPFMHARCGGGNLSPQLSWSGAPPAARSLAITMIDRDVRPAMFTHWLVVGLPPTVTTLPRGASRLPAGGVTAPNDFGEAAYGGPCPPRGSGVHHYLITVWAMPTASPAISQGFRADDVAATLARGALDHATLVVTAQR